MYAFTYAFTLNGSPVLKSGSYSSGRCRYFLNVIFGTRGASPARVQKTSMVVLFETISDGSTASLLCEDILKFTAKNLLSHVVIHTQIKNVSRDIHPKHHSTKANIREYNGTRGDTVGSVR